MTEMFGEAWSPMSVPDLAPDDDDDCRPEAIYGGDAENVDQQLPFLSIL